MDYSKLFDLKMASYSPLSQAHPLLSSNSYLNTVYFLNAWSITLFLENSKSISNYLSIDKSEKPITLKKVPAAISIINAKVKLDSEALE